MRWPFSAARRKRKAASARPLPADMARSYQPRIRRLEERRVLDVSAAFTSATGQLDILISNSADTATLTVANGQVVVTDSQNQAVPIDVDGGGPSAVNASHVNRIDAQGDASAGQAFRLDSPLLLPSGLTVASSIERAELNGAISQVSGGDVRSDAALTRLGADISSVDRDIRFGGDVELLADVRLTGRNVELMGQLNDDGLAGSSSNLQIDAHGLTTLGSDVGTTASLSRLETDAAGRTELGGNVQSAGGAVEFADPVTLMRDVRISDMGGGGVWFGSTLDSRDGGFFGLRLETPSGRVAFLGDIGAGAMGEQRLGELIVEQAGDGVLFGDGGMSAVQVRGTIDLGTGTHLIGGPGIVWDAGTATLQVETFGGTFRANGAVVLASDLYIDSLGGNVEFTSGAPIDSADNLTQSLTIRAEAGAVFFHEDVGGQVPLRGLTITRADGGVRFGGSDTETPGGAGPVANVRSVDVLRIGATHAILGSGIVLNGGANGLRLSTSGDAILLNGAVVLASDVAIDTGAGLGDIRFATGPIDSAMNESNDLELNAGSGSIFFSHDLGATQPLGSVTVLTAGGGVTWGTADVASPDGSGPVQIVRAEQIDVGSGANPIGGTGIVWNGGDLATLTISTLTGAARWNGAVTLDSDVHIASAGNITFTNDAPIDSRTGERHSLTLNTATGVIAFNEDIGRQIPLSELTVVRAGAGLVLGGATTETAGTGGLGPVESIRLDGAFQAGTGANAVGGLGIVVRGSAVAPQTVTTTGDIVRWNGPTELHTDLVVTTDGGDIVFTNEATIDSAAGRVGGLLLDARAGAVRFNADIGANRRIGALTVTQADAGMYFGEAEDASSGPGMQGPVQQIHADRPVELGSLSSTATGFIRFQGGMVGTLLTTTGDAIGFHRQVLLAGDLQVESGTGGDVLFTAAATIDSTGGAGGGPGQRSNLLIDAGSASVSFNASIGDNQSLDALTVVRAGGGVLFGGSDTVTTAGRGPVTRVRADGGLDLGAGPTPATALGSIVWNGGTAIVQVDTQGGSVRMHGPVTLQSGLEVATHGGSVSMSNFSPVESEDGEFAPLTLVVDGGDVTVGGAVGSSARLGTVTIQGPRNVTFLQAVRAARLVQLQGTGLTTFAGAVDTNDPARTGLDLEGVAFHFQSGVRASGDGRISIRHSGLLDIAPTANLRIDGSFSESGGTVDLGGAIATSGDSVQFASPVRLTDGQLGNVLISTVAGGHSAGALIQFEQAIEGQTRAAENLVLNAGTAGDIEVLQTIGQVTRAGSMTVVAARDVTFHQAVRAARIVQLSGTGTTAFLGSLDLHHDSQAAAQIDTVNVTLVGPVQTTGEGTTQFTVTGELVLAASADMALRGGFQQLGPGIVRTAADIATSGGPIGFAGAVQLAGDVRWSTGAGPGDVTLANTLDGAQPLQQSLTIDTGTGDVAFLGTIGSNAPLRLLSITQARDVRFTQLVTLGSLVQSAGSGETQWSDTVTVLAAGGTVFLHNQTITADGNVLAQGNAIHWIADDVLTVGAVVSTQVGPITLESGSLLHLLGAGQVTSGSGDVLLLGDRDATGGGAVRMEDGSVVAASFGAIQVAATGDIQLGRLVANSLVALESTAGRVVDGGDATGANIVAPLFVLRTHAGAGLDNPIETSVRMLAGVNTLSGGIRLSNAGPDVLTLGEVDGLAGLINNGEGPIEIIHRGGIDVLRRVSNRGGGDTILRAELPGNLNIAAPVQNTGGDGFVLLFAGGDLIIRDSLPEPFDANGQQIENPSDPLQFFEIFVEGEGGVRGAAAGRVRIDDGDQNFAIVHTATGQMTNAPPMVEIETIDQGGSDVDALGRAFVRVTLGDATHLETNYHITIDWGDGEVESFPIPGTINPRRLPDFPGSTEVRFVSGNGAEGEYVFLHRYFENPNSENPSAPVPIRVDVRYDARASGNTAVDANRPDTGSPVFNGIRWFELGGQEVFTSLTDSFTVPGSGVFGFVKVVESVIVPVEARVARVATAAVTPASYTPSLGITDEYASASLETEVVAEYRVFMRVVDDVTHAEGPDIPLNESVLEDPIAIFRNRRFPNGHYRVYLEELRTRRIRLILDVHIYNGRVVPPNFREAAGEQRSPAPEDASAVPSGARAVHEPMTMNPRTAWAAFQKGPVSPAADDRSATAWIESSDADISDGHLNLSAEQPEADTTGPCESESGHLETTTANAGTELAGGLPPSAGAAGLLAGGLAIRTHTGGAAGPERPLTSAIPRLTKAARRWRRGRHAADAALPDGTRIAHGQAAPRRVANSQRQAGT